MSNFHEWVIVPEKCFSKKDPLQLPSSLFRTYNGKYSGSPPHLKFGQHFTPRPTLISEACHLIPPSRKKKYIQQRLCCCCSWIAIPRFEPFSPVCVALFWGGNECMCFFFFLPFFSPLLLCNYRLGRSGPSPSSGKRNRKLLIPRYVAWHNVFSRIEWRKKLLVFFCFLLLHLLEWPMARKWLRRIFFTEIRFLGFRFETKKVLFPLSCLSDDFERNTFGSWDNKTLRLILLPISPTPRFPNHILAIHDYEFY